jgi:hypothetical protein
MFTFDGSLYKLLVHVVGLSSTNFMLKKVLV